MDVAVSNDFGAGIDVSVNGNVTKMNEAPNGHRPIYLMDEARTPQLSGQR